MLVYEKVFLINNQKIFGCIKEFCLQDIIHLDKKELEIWRQQKEFSRNGKDWLAGRLSAKLSIAKCLNIYEKQLENIHINNNNRGVPYVEIKEKNVIFSISHSLGTGFACSSLNLSGIGCDIEKIKVRHPNFNTYFLNNYEEQSWKGIIPDGKQDIISTVTWSCKEASYKCLCSIGDTIESLYDINVYPIPDNTHSYRFFYKNREGLGYWEKHKDFIVSVAVLP